jgi:hypothetical protein
MSQIVCASRGRDDPLVVITWPFAFKVGLQQVKRKSILRFVHNLGKLSFHIFSVA